MVDTWEKSYMANTEITVPVFLINDLNRSWNGKITLLITENGKQISRQFIAGSADAFKVEIKNFKVQIPAKAGNYKLIARIKYKGQWVESVRDIPVIN